MAPSPVTLAIVKDVAPTPQIPIPSKEHPFLTKIVVRKAFAACRKRSVSRE